LVFHSQHDSPASSLASYRQELAYLVDASRIQHNPIRDYFSHGNGIVLSIFKVSENAIGKEIGAMTMLMKQIDTSLYHIRLPESPVLYHYSH
jgi:hypothetical protein